MRLSLRPLLLLPTLAAALSVTAADNPRVQALVPGLEIRRLPLRLTNINSVDYGPDGRLYAAGYDGRVHVLTDADGDGLEDTAQPYWNEPGDLLTPVGILATEQGLYVAARGKVVLLKDTNGDGLADVSETVAAGWEKETVNSDTRNDAAGVAMDAAGNLYFSLGCMSYNKAWQLDDQGRSRYDPRSERGTILKVSPDGDEREIVATGLRFVIGLEFNKHGDLFATDQEGDTWFPGGNPLDELLHIIPGRHYGFPFRHPRYLPDVVDEPSVVDFSPQHQSTCGFRFNEQRAHRAPVGPDFWEGNAIVTGFSRGKLWRSPLTKTRAGYVGKQIQIAAFESLLSDVAISPDGALLVTGHGGRPDWGSGPGGEGQLYRITVDGDAPQPVAAWPAGPTKTRIAFDRPVTPGSFGVPRIDTGEHRWEGVEQEWVWPGYEVVKAEKRAPHRPLAVDDVSFSEDGRTVTLTTAPHPWRARYRVVLPRNEAEPDVPFAELSYNLGGVVANWTGDTATVWNGWLPHVDLAVARTLTRGSAEHAELERLLVRPGLLTLTSELLLPGAKVNFRLEADRAFRVRIGEVDVAAVREGERHVATLSVSSDVRHQPSEARGGREEVLPTEAVPLVIEMRTGGDDSPRLDVSYQADFDPHERPLRLEHLTVPWAPRTRPGVETGDPAVLAGDPAKGRKLFFGAVANCAKCHAVDGEGADVAADLTVSRHRSPEAVLRDIVEPNAAINPDYVSYEVKLKDGESLFGLIRDTTGEQLRLVDAGARVHEIDKSDIARIRPASLSLMPEGYAELGEEQLRDLIAFLLGAGRDE